MSCSYTNVTQECFERNSEIIWGKRKKHYLGSRRMQKWLLITVCPYAESGYRYWRDLLCFLIWGLHVGKQETREVGAAAFVGLSETGVPSVALGPGRESCWKGRFPSTFSWSPWRLAIWGTLAECWSTDTCNFMSKRSRCFENGWKWAWWPNDEAANRSIF